MCTLQMTGFLSETGIYTSLNQSIVSTTPVLVVPSDEQLTHIVLSSGELKKMDEGVTWVFLLSYQRTGSSFIGRIFKDPERSFYIYEPLDPLYAAMYGVSDSWTVPSDIFNNKDGSLR